MRGLAVPDACLGRLGPGVPGPATESGGAGLLSCPDLCAAAPNATQVALQEGEYRRWTEALEGLLESYYKARPARGRRREPAAFALHGSEGPDRMPCRHACCGPAGSLQFLNAADHIEKTCAQTLAVVTDALCRQVVDALGPAERDLLSSKLAGLARALEPGLSRLNWNSRGIDDFVGKAGAAVHEFQGLVNQASARVHFHV